MLLGPWGRFWGTDLFLMWKTQTRIRQPHRKKVEATIIHNHNTQTTLSVLVHFCSYGDIPEAGSLYSKKRLIWLTVLEV